MSAQINDSVTDFEQRLLIYPYIEQQTEEGEADPTWLDWRKGLGDYPTENERPRITGSVVDALIGSSPFEEAADVYDDYMGERKKFVNDAMKAGTKYEPRCRELACEELEIRQKKEKQAKLKENITKHLDVPRAFCEYGRIIEVGPRAGNLAHASITNKVVLPMLRSLGMSPDAIKALLETFRGKAGETGSYRIYLAGEEEETSEGETPTIEGGPTEEPEKKKRGRPRKNPT